MWTALCRQSPFQGHTRPAGLPPGGGQVQEFTSSKTAALRFASPRLVRVLTCVYTAAMTCGAHPFLARTDGAKNGMPPALLQAAVSTRKEAEPDSVD